MSNKIITEEILWEKLEAQDIKQPYDAEHEDKLKAVLDHWDAEIVNMWDDSCSRWFYIESTADGYEVYVSTYGDPNSICVSEDIYYYNHDWLRDMHYAIRDGARIYFSELDEENYEFQEVIDELYEHYFENKVEEMQDELIENGWVLQNDVVIDA